VRSFLGLLEQSSVPMAICSGALLTEIELVLAEAKLRHLFSAIVSAEQVRKGKPNPEGFLLTLRKLNENGQQAIKGNECVVIEDSRWGLEAAKAAGMHAVAVTNTYEADQLSLADKIVSCLSELTIEDLQQICK
jgi:beta-phosphoglucomutase